VANWFPSPNVTVKGHHSRAHCPRKWKLPGVFPPATCSEDPEPPQGCVSPTARPPGFQDACSDRLQAVLLLPGRVLAQTVDLSRMDARLKPSATRIPSWLTILNGIGFLSCLGSVL
jgi:hypothetical protein